jgi:hypothetical protein
MNSIDVLMKKKTQKLPKFSLYLFVYFSFFFVCFLFICQCYFVNFTLNVGKRRERFQSFFLNEKNILQFFFKKKIYCLFFFFCFYFCLFVCLFLLLLFYLYHMVMFFHFSFVSLIIIIFFKFIVFPR